MGCRHSKTKRVGHPNPIHGSFTEAESNKKGRSRFRSHDNNKYMNNNNNTNNNNNNNSNMNKKTRRHDEDLDDGDEILPFSPSPSLRQWYDAQVEDVQKLFHAPTGGHDKPMSTTPLKASGSWGGGGGGGGNSSSNNNFNKKKGLNKGEVSLKPGVLTLYHVAPLKHIIGRGYYSEVMLADMTIHTTTTKTNAIPEESEQVKQKNKSGKCKSSVLVRNPSITSGRESVTIAPPTRYLIACKEYTLRGENANFMYKKLREEVQRLTRLGFSSRLLKVLQMESVYDDPKETGEDAIIIPDVPDLITPDSPSATINTNTSTNINTTPAAISFSTTIPPPPAVSATVAAAAAAAAAAGLNGETGSGTGNSSFFGSKQQIQKTNDRSGGASRHRAPNKVRIYMEYARYGTLRNMLLTEIPERFGRTYMHELMVRAYMRDVLVALAFLHENNVIHTDLCAKNVYLVNHIQNVYSTCFPAYIADIPAGKFSKVPTHCVRRVLALMDPASMHLHYHTDITGHLLNDSVISNAGWNPQEKAMKQNAANEGDAPLLGQTTVTIGNTFNTITNNNNNSHIINTTNENNDNNISKATFNVPDNNENNEMGCHWVDEDVKLYLRENAYNNNEDIPLPSPLSSVDHVNVFKNPNMEGVTIVRGGSFAGPSQMPVFPPVLLSGMPSGEYVRHGTNAIRKDTSNNNSTSMTCNNNNNNNNNNENSFMNNDSKFDMYQNEESSVRRYSAELTALNSTQTDQAENSITHYPAGRRRCKPLIKLGHYGRIRSLLVGEGDDTVSRDKVHRLGRVTHLAPELYSGGSFSPGSDIYAFAMMFIELSTPLGGVFADLRPATLAVPRTRQEKDAFDAEWLANIKAYLLQHDYTVPLPPHLSAECQSMLRKCLRYDPARRPTAVELLQSKYFLFGHWAKEATASGAMEAPWLDTNYEAAAQASGLPRLPSDTKLYDTETMLRAAAAMKSQEATKAGV